MKLLDLFCGQGGAACGYFQAGFTDIVGVDIKPQPRYPFKFVKANALLYLLSLIQSGGINEFDLVHASPPCQAYSVTKPLSNGNHPDLVGVTRDLLDESGLPYVIENVPGSPLKNYVVLCGSMFPGLRVIRHRLFEIKPYINIMVTSCNHRGGCHSNGKNDRLLYGTPKLKYKKFMTVTGHDFIVRDAKIAMNCHHMTQAGLSQAIPPAYTKYIGEMMMEVIR